MGEVDDVLKLKIQCHVVTIMRLILCTLVS